MLSDIETFDVMLGENRFDDAEREESLDSNLARWPERSTSDNFGNRDENMSLNHRGICSGINNDYG